MWPFKKKKIYKVLYADECGNYDCAFALVKAIDVNEAWKEIRKLGFKPHRPIVCISITEL
jgi:hypothetical protein